MQSPDFSNQITLHRTKPPAIADLSDALAGIELWFAALNKLDPDAVNPYNWKHPALVEWLHHQGKRDRHDLTPEDICVLQMSLAGKMRQLLKAQEEGLDD